MQGSWNYTTLKSAEQLIRRRVEYALISVLNIEYRISNIEYYLQIEKRDKTMVLFITRQNQTK